MQKQRASILIGHSYQMGERIGSGSFGQIYAGVDLRSGEEVAIKLVLPSISL